MKNKEDLIRNIFKDDQSLEGIQPDNLWSAIEEGLEDPAEVSAPNNRSYRALFLLVLLCVISGGLYLLNSSDDTTLLGNNKLADTHIGTTTSQIITKPILGKENEDLSLQTVEKPKHLAKLKSKTSLSKQNEIKTTDQSTNKTKSIREISAYKKVVSKKVIKNINQDKNNSSITKATFEDSEPIKKEDNTLEQVATINQELTTSDLMSKMGSQTNKETLVDDAKVVDQILSSTQDLINPSPFLELFVKDKEVILPPNPVFRSHSVDVASHSMNSPKWSLGILTGVNWMHTHFIKGSNDLINIDELQKSNISRLGSYTAFDVAYQISPQMALVSGLDFNMINYTFDRSTVTQLQKTVERVTYYEVDPMTGEHINIQMGNKTINIEKTHTVVHQNKFKLVSIPFSVRFLSQKGKIILGGDAGLSYNVFVQQKGRFVNDENTITSFDDTDSHLISPYKKSFFGVHVKPFINYKIKENLGIKVATSIHYLNNGRSNLVGLNQKSYLMNFSVGLNYHL